MLEADYVVPVTGTDYVDLTEIARMAGITPDSARTYHTRANMNRRAGTPRSGDLPPPDLTVAGRPAWRRATIERWLSSRPGRGVERCDG